jgi:putative membrane protein
VQGTFTDGFPDRPPDTSGKPSFSEEERKGPIVIIRRALLVAVAVLVGAFALPAAAANDVNPTDDWFIQTEAAGNAFEVQGGKLALTHASSQVVRAFGAKMIHDHARGSAQVSSIARRLHLSTAPEPDPAQKWQLEQLSKEWGAQFDHDYIDLEKGDHVMDVQDAKRETTYGFNALIKGYAKRWTPILKMHRDMADKAMAELGA